MLLGAAAAAYFYHRNHKRVRRAKSCMPARPLAFLAGTARKADVWRMRAAGYEFVQTGRYLTSYAEQMEKLRDDTKVQLLAEGGDAGVPSDATWSNLGVCPPRVRVPAGATQVTRPDHYKTPRYAGTSLYTVP